MCKRLDGIEVGITAEVECVCEEGFCFYPYTLTNWLGPIGKCALILACISLGIHKTLLQHTFACLIVEIFFLPQTII